MNDYIYKSSLALDNINNGLYLFEYEAKLMDYIKCELINDNELNDFEIDGINVSVIKNGDDYELISSVEDIKVETYDGLVIDYYSR